jgi:transcriptional regulator with XRE-family HTH domain
MNTPGKRLKHLREHLNLTQEALGEKLGLSWYQIKDMETAKVKITVPIAKLLSYETDVNAKWLLSGEGNMFEKKTMGDLTRDLQIGEILHLLRDDPNAKRIIYQFLQGRKEERKVLVYVESQLSAEKKFRWDEIRRLLGVPSDIFHFTIETEDLKLAHKEMQLAIRTRSNLVLIGSAGSGKTVIVNTFAHKTEGPGIIYIKTYGEHNFYSGLIVGMEGANAKLSRKMSDRRLQAIRLLDRVKPKKIALIIEEAHYASEEALRDIISFQRGPAAGNLSLFLVGQSTSKLTDLPNCEIFRLKGLSPIDMKRYIREASSRSGNKLPVSVPAMILRGARDFIDLQDRYLEYAWKTVAQRES